MLLSIHYSPLCLFLSHSPLFPYLYVMLALLFFPPGYLIMTDEWFSEYVYEVVVDKKYLSSEVLEVMQQEPVMLPAWDPMGALA